MATTTTTTTTSVRDAVWCGAVPLAISSPAHGAVFHTLAPRGSYLPLLVPALRDFLFTRLRKPQADVATSDTHVWFEYNNLPLKWHYPIGLLYDIQTMQSQHATTSHLVPWSITVHWDAPPSDQLIPIDEDGKGPNTLRDHFMAMIKESDYLCNGSIKKVMSLSKEMQTQLWTSIVSNQFDEYRVAYTALMGQQQQQPHQQTQPHQQKRSVAMRLYCVSPKTSQVVTVIHDVFPPTVSAVEASATGTHVSPPETPSSSETTSPVHHVTLGEALHRSLSMMNTDASTVSLRAILHGVDLDLQTHLSWLSDHATYPDTFLHIVVIID